MIPELLMDALHDATPGAHPAPVVSGAESKVPVVVS
jgi:hypothetical protein